MVHEPCCQCGQSEETTISRDELIALQRSRIKQLESLLRQVTLSTDGVPIVVGASMSWFDGHAHREGVVMETREADSLIAYGDPAVIAYVPNDMLIAKPQED